MPGVPSQCDVGVGGWFSGAVTAIIGFGWSRLDWGKVKMVVCSSASGKTYFDNLGKLSIIYCC